jgi:hypothetical protein
VRGFSLLGELLPHARVAFGAFHGHAGLLPAFKPLIAHPPVLTQGSPDKRLGSLLVRNIVMNEVMNAVVLGKRERSTKEFFNVGIKFLTIFSRMLHALYIVARTM